MTTIGDFIRSRRDKLLISQAELAAKLTLHGHTTTKANVGHWEKGRHDPPIDDKDFRLALALSLEMDVNELMNQLGFVVTSDNRSRNALLAADMMDELPVDAQEMVLDIIKSIRQRYASTA